MFSLAIDTGCSTLIATAIKDFQNVYYGFGCNGDDNDGHYLHNIVVQFALSSICGRPADQGKQDALTILTHKHDDDEDFRKVRVVKPKSGSGK